MHGRPVPDRVTTSAVQPNPTLVTAVFNFNLSATVDSWHLAGATLAEGRVGLGRCRASLGRN